MSLSSVASVEVVVADGVGEVRGPDARPGRSRRPSPTRTQPCCRVAGTSAWPVRLPAPAATRLGPAARGCFASVSAISASSLACSVCAAEICAEIWVASVPGRIEALLREGQRVARRVVGRRARRRATARERRAGRGGRQSRRITRCRMSTERASRLRQPGSRMRRLCHSLSSSVVSSTSANG